MPTPLSSHMDALDNARTTTSMLSRPENSRMDVLRNPTRERRIG